MNFRPQNVRSWLRTLVSEPMILSLIAINGLAVFVTAFPNLHEPWRGTFQWLEYICMSLFVVEAAIKIGLMGWREYFRWAWNRFDFLVVLVCMPLLMHTPGNNAGMGAFAIAPLLRVARFLRFVRVIRFIPNAAHLWAGSLRALRASVGVFAVLLVLNLIMGLGANLLFARQAPEHFGDPIVASYTLFKVFTIEGWHEVPDQMAQNPDITSTEVAIIRGYFILAVVIGGILGLSLANAVFVDEMTMDNNDELERQVAAMREELKALRDDLMFNSRRNR